MYVKKHIPTYNLRNNCQSCLLFYSKTTDSFVAKTSFREKAQNKSDLF